MVISKHLCEICNRDYPSFKEAQGCEAKGLPKTIVPSGTVFINVDFEQNLNSARYYVLGNPIYLAARATEHLQVYDGEEIIYHIEMIYGKFTVSSSQQCLVSSDGSAILDWNDQTKLHKRVSAQHLEALCRDPKFRAVVDRNARNVEKSSKV